MTSELAAIDWLGRGWLLLLAFTVAVLLVAGLRKPCRHLFGTERAFQLWLLPPLAMLASQLPHAAVIADASRQPAVFVYAAAAIGLPSHVAHASSIDWRASVILFWLSGMMVSLLLGVVVQGRYRARLRGATPVDAEFSSRRVLRATRADVGPALVGAWRPCIVLPADFEQRYDTAEQRLILAHEDMHARRGDGWWCLLARAVAALFWFHPLAWWALSALRHDQELACDAAVLREHGEYRRSYANAMLKTQLAAFALPVGCSWSPRHPVTERIAMLKMPIPNRLPRIVGRITLMAIILGVSVSIYAAHPASRTYAATPEAVKEAFALFEGAKMAVADYAAHHDFRMPANNDAAGLPDDPNLVNGKFVRGVSVRDGVIVAMLREKPDSVSTAGSVQLVPRRDGANMSMVWACESADIPEIAKLAHGCVYRPGAAGDAPTAGNTDRYTLKLELAVDGKPARLHATMCLKHDQFYNVTETAIGQLPPWHGRFTIVPAERGELEVRGELSGGSMTAPGYPRLRMLPGQQGTIQIGQQVHDKQGHVTEDHTIKIDVTPSVGC